MRDISFLTLYIKDELQFKGPHFARSIDLVKQVGDDDFDYMKSINHPIHLSLANDD